MSNEKDILMMYYDKKNKCPNCKSKELVPTGLDKLDIEKTILKYGEFRDRKNKTACGNCGWQGCIDDLKP